MQLCSTLAIFTQFIYYLDLKLSIYDLLAKLRHTTPTTSPSHKNKQIILHDFKLLKQFFYHEPHSILTLLTILFCKQ